MLAHTKMHPTNPQQDSIKMQHAGAVYLFPKKIAEKYRLLEETVHSDEIFSNLNKKYSKPGALLKGIRLRENLTQVEMANALSVTQSDISQIEHGTRNIGKKLAQRIEKLFGIDYRSFL